MASNAYLMAIPAENAVAAFVAAIQSSPGSGLRGRTPAGRGTGGRRTRGGSRGGSRGGPRGRTRRGAPGRGRVDGRVHKRSRQGRGRSHGGRRFEPAPTPTVPVPIWHGDYQLVGDSMLSRFLQATVPEATPPTYNEHLRAKQIGNVVHGQTVAQLVHLLQSPYSTPLASKIILMIGTNDILKKVPLAATLKKIETSINILTQAAADGLVILTVPPIPRLPSSHLQDVQVLNNFVKGVTRDVPNVYVIDIFNLFLKEDSTVNESLYEMTFKSKDTDKIHWNAAGMSRVAEYLHSELRLSCCPEDSTMNDES